MVKNFVKTLFIATAIQGGQPALADTHDVSLQGQPISATGDFNRAASPAAPDYEPGLWTDLEEDGVASSLYKHITLLTEDYSDILEKFLGGHIPVRPYFSAYQLSIKNDEELAAEFDLPQDRFESYRASFYELFDHVDFKTNCYSYAVNDREGHYPGGKPNPGEYSGFPGLSSDNISIKDRIMGGAVSDGLTPAGDSLPVIQDGYYRVALFINESDPDYHWLREDSNGLWSQKFGYWETFNYDFDEKPITNPDTANFDDYKLVQYYYVPEGGIDLQSLTPDIRPKARNVGSGPG